jgi:hypothetical protein
MHQRVTERAIAPRNGLRRDGSALSSDIQSNETDANASLTSKWSMSSMRSPVLSSSRGRNEIALTDHALDLDLDASVSRE